MNPWWLLIGGGLWFLAALALALIIGHAADAHNEEPHP